MTNSLPAIIFVSLENWDDVWRRNQFICAELSRRRPDAKILFVGLPLDVSNAVRTLKVGRLLRANAKAIKEFPNISTTYPLKILPNSVGLGHIVNDFIFRFHICRAKRKLGMVKPILWLNSHAAGHLVGKVNESVVIYDVTDDWTALNQADGVRKRTIEQDARLCRQSDAVIVCSQRLLEMKQPLSRCVSLIANGVDAVHYEQVCDRTGPTPFESTGWAKPVFGYTGTAHPDRVDVELVASLSENLHSGSLVFVGPNHFPADIVASLTRRGNVHFTGPVPYQKIPDYMRVFDVCIVPHRITPFTESLNPIKLWEYLAAGKPIVSTPVAGFRDYPQFVSLASTADQFLESMRTTLTEDSGLPAARRAEAVKHSWATRVNRIEEVLADAIHRRKISSD